MCGDKTPHIDYFLLSMVPSGISKTFFGRRNGTPDRIDVMLRFTAVALLHPLRPTGLCRTTVLILI